MRFSKIPFKEYALVRTSTNAKAEYDSIQLPKRSTSGSAGYDFYMPFSAIIPYKGELMIPTGIRVLLDKDKFLMCVPRSGLGVKYKFRLKNTCGIIDYDYAFSENWGHIIAFVCNEGSNDLELKAGDRFMQGIIMQYFVTDDDNTNNTRNGGFGSTGGHSL